MVAKVETRFVYYVTRETCSPKRKIDYLTCHVDQSLARRVASFIEECGYGRFSTEWSIGVTQSDGLVEMVLIEAGRILRNKGPMGDIVRVETEFSPKQYIQIVDDLEKKEKIRIRLAALEEEAQEEAKPIEKEIRNAKLYRVETRSNPWGRWDHIGFYRTQHLAKRVERFVRECVWPKGVDVQIDDPYQATIIKAAMGWRVKETFQGALFVVADEFDPKACIDPIRYLLEKEA